MQLSTNTRTFGWLGVALGLAVLSFSLVPLQARAQCALQQSGITIELVFKAVNDEGPPTYFWYAEYEPAQGNPRISDVYFQKASDGNLASPSVTPLSGGVTNWSASGIATIPGSSIPAIRFEYVREKKLDKNGGTFQFRYTTKEQDPIRVYARSTNGNVFDQVFTGSNCSTLPVELVAFDVALNGEEALLQWQTSAERNNVGFDVEHAAPGTSAFRTLGFVEGHGTTTQAQTYAFRVEALTPGTHRFRLRQVDFDGTTSYGPVLEVAVGLPEQAYLSDVWPNPFNPQTQFTLEVKQAQAVRVEVFDALGRRVARLHEGTLEAGHAHAFRFEAASLPSGVYLVRATGETFTQTRRATLLK